MVQQSPFLGGLVTVGLIALVLFILNIFLNNIFLDLLCGIAYAYLYSFFLAVYSSETVLGSTFHFRAQMFFIMYLLVYFIYYRYVGRILETESGISKKDYEGLVGTSITTIPENSMGEIMVTVGFQKISMPAKLYKGGDYTELTFIDSGASILIIEQKDSYVEVIPYNENFKIK